MNSVEGNVTPHGSEYLKMANIVDSKFLLNPVTEERILKQTMKKDKEFEIPLLT